MAAFIDITGMMYGSWSVILYAGKSKWLCRCKCGTEALVAGASLRDGASTQCRGCATAELNRRSKVGNKNNVTHGESRTRMYRIWCGMVSRCETESSSGFKYYGSKGVSVCEEWHRFEPFKDWALSHGYKSNLSIDRIDVYGNYCPENCRWATNTEQALNKRNSRSNRKEVMPNDNRNQSHSDT